MARTDEELIFADKWGDRLVIREFMGKVFFEIALNGQIDTSVGVPISQSEARKLGEWLIKASE